MQFTVESLARLISNVESEILVQALEEAGLTHVLATDANETLREIAGWLNLVENMLTLGPAALEASVEAAMRGTVLPPNTRAALRLIDTYLEFFSFMPIMKELSAGLDKVLEGLDISPVTFNRENAIVDLHLANRLAHRLANERYNLDDASEMGTSIGRHIHGLARTLGISTWEYM